MRNLRFILSPLCAAAALLLLPSGARAQAPDTDPPQIEIRESGTVLVDGALFNRAAAPVITVTDASPVTVTATLDGAAFTSGTAVSGQGTHQLAVSATDEAGNTASSTIGFEIDTAPPVFGTVQPAAETVTSSLQVTLQGTVTGATAVTVDGQPAALTGSDWSAGPYTLPQGVKSWMLAARDAAGNTAQKTHRLIVDTQAPALSVAQPAAGVVLRDAAVDVVGSVTDPHLGAVTVNGTAASVTGTSWLARQVPLAEGDNVLLALAEDQAGNAAQVSRTVVRDTQAPQVAVTDPAPGTVVPGATIMLRGTASDAHLDRVEVGGVRAQIGAGGETWSLSVTLREGVNDLAVKAFDKIGNSAAASLTVTRDSQAPAIRIVQPADGASLKAATVTVTGTVEEEAGLIVTVNGTPAAVTGGTFTVSGIALVEGRNTLIARVRDSLGNQGVYTRQVTRDTVAPRLLAAEPAAGALAVPLDAAFRLSFSEDLDTPAAGSWRLETAAGQALTATGSLAGAVLTVRPAAALPPSAQIRLVLTAALADPAGNALAAPSILTYTTADTGAPAAPALSPLPPARLCASSLLLTGTTEAEAQLRVTGGGAAAEGRADATGHFSLAVSLTPEGLNRLWLTASDAGGNRSAPTIVDVITDWQAPRVVSAERQGSAFRVRFSEAVAPASLAGALTLTAAAGGVAGTPVLAADGLTATFTPTVTLPAGALRLEVAAAVKDLAGNAMAYPWSQIFGGDGGTGFLTGTVIDDATGRPLTGARVIVVASNGTPRTAPLPEQVTGPDGRFRIPIGAGTHDLTIAHPGYTPSFRIATTVAGQGTDIFDPRLTPAGTSAGLTLPAGALGNTAAVIVTRLDEQGLPIQLPYGWAPRGAVWVDLGGESLLQTGHLSFPVESPDGTTLTVVKLDLLSLQWRVLGDELVVAGQVDFDLAPGSAEGSYAAVEADSGDTAPPAPVVGAALAGAPHPSGSALTGATLTFDPQVVLPSQTSRATATYQMPSDAHIASGLPLTLSIEEHLELLDNSTRQQAPYEADLVLYHAPGSAQTPRSRFRLKPSAVAESVPLRLGSENVKLRTYGDESVGGNVIDLQGGTVASPEGDQVNVPYGALPEPTAVTLTRKAAADLPLAVPAGTVLAGAVALDLGGQRLLVPAALSLALATPPAAGSHALLLTVVDLPAGKAWRAVAALDATAGGWATAVIDPEDLAWPGVRDEGLYAFVQPTAPFGYFRGTVQNLAAAPLSGAVVKGSTAVPLQLMQLTNADGTYALPAPLGTAAVTAQDLETGNSGAAIGTLAADQERVDLDLTVQPVGPHVVQFTPADGATDVPQGIEPVIRFSEPVDPATLDGGIQLLLGTSPVTIDLDAQGAVVRLVPRSTLLPGTAYEIRVGSGVHDLQGNPNAPAAAHFMTRRVLVPTDVNLAKIFLIEPDVANNARVEGRAGAVPSGTTVSVENLGPFQDFPIPPVVSATADLDGSFDLTIPAKLTHTLILHVLIAGGNEVVARLTPFHTVDLRGAHVGSEAASFTTVDGVTVDVPAGTFPAETLVRVTPRTAGTIPAPSFLTPVYEFTLDFGGAEAAKSIQVSVPAAGNAAEGVYLVNRRIEALGEPYWMLHDLARLDHGRLTTAEATTAAAASATTAPAPARKASNRLPTALFEAAVALRPKEYLPGLAFQGIYQITAPQIPLGFTAFPILDLNQMVGIWNDATEGMVSVVNAAIARLLHQDGILIPTRLGQPSRLTVRNLETGFRLYDGTIPAATNPGVVVLPPDIYGDVAPPYPVSGNPVRFYLLNLLHPGASAEVALGISSALSSQTLTVTGQPGAAHPRVQIRLLGLDDSAGAETTSGEDGSFTLSAPAVAGKRYVLAVGALVSPADALEISFNESLDNAFSGIEILDAQGRSLAQDAAPVGTRATVRLVPAAGWKAGETYTLRLGPSLADSSGNTWRRNLTIQFKVSGSQVLDTFGLTNVRDIARLGSLLFVAADTDGLVVLDASDPAHLKNFAPGNIRFPFPLNDPVYGVTVDPHGRVLVAGGGINGPGQLKIFDPLALDLAALAAAPNDPALRSAAWRGSTVISDKLGGGLFPQLPGGKPRRVSVVSDDAADEWTFGEGAAPVGLTVTAQSGVVTVAGTGTVHTGALFPVTLQNLSRASWSRVDAAAGGQFSVSIKASPGDRLRLLRNSGSFAYVSTPGVGVEVVQVETFYGEQGNPTVSDLRGVYSGIGDLSLRLCNEPVPDLASATLDLEALVDAANLHPLTLVNLVGFRGIALLESNPEDIAKIRFLNEQCADDGGDRNVSGMAVLPQYAFDFNHDGALGADEARDYVLVSHRTAGVLIYDVTDRENIVIAGQIRLPGPAANVSVDRAGRRLFVSGFLGGLYVVDFSLPPSRALLDRNADGVDDRVLETIVLPASTSAAARFVPELGVAFVGSVGAGGQTGGVSSIAISPPKVQAVTAGAENLQALAEIVPFGVPAGPSVPGSPGSRGSFRLVATLPGVMGPQVFFDVESLSAGGQRVAEAAADPSALPGLPRAALTGDHGVALHRMAEHLWENGYQRYISGPVAAVAELRAARAYQRTAAEDSKCPRCDPSAEGVGEQAQEILSGDWIAVRPSPALRDQLLPIFDKARLDAMSVKLKSVRWETAPAVEQEPAQNPSIGAGVILSSGEITQSATDLAIAGRGFDFAFRRFYRSQTVGSGPFGPGWDFNYHQRLRELPNGDVELYDGSGRRELFVHGTNGLAAPKGVFVSLDKVASGWVLLDAGHNLTRFDLSGRLASIADAVKDAADTGNELTFHYDTASRLVRVKDTLGRDILFTYDTKGRITAITDFDGRAFTYEYDAAGRLAKVLTPPVTTAFVGGTVMVTQVEPLATEYTYNAATGDLAQALNRRDNLASVKDAKSQSWLSVSYGDPNQDQRNDEVTGQVWGGGSIGVQYQPGERQATVTDPRGHSVLYTHTAAGQVQKIKDAKQAEAQFEYDGEGLMTKSTAPLGRVTRYFYDTPCDGTPGLGKRRSRGNLTKTEVTPDDRGANGSADMLASCTDYEPVTNQPVRIVDPRGIATRIERNALGLPELVEQAAGTPDAATTRTTYNEFGQPVRVVNPNGHASTYQYFTAGPSTGYLERTVSDPSGLALTTRFETDARGNVTALVDPRGVRHERTFNVLNWLTESRRATTASLDGAPALGYVTRYFYDPNGNLVETQLPYDDGAAITRVRRIFGPLDELLQVQREIKPGDPLTSWITETNVYDENRNLERTLGPDGQITKFDYDERDQVSKVTAGFSTLDELATIYTYDAEGQPLTVIDPRGAVWTTHYDGYGRPRETIDPLNNRSLAVYDNASQPVEASAYEGAEKLLARRSTVFDALGRPKSLTSKLWSYDPNTPGLPLSARDLTSRWEYDAASNLKRMIDPLQRATVWEYDPAERQVAAVDALGNRVEHDLDPAGNPVVTRSLEKEPSGGTVTVTTRAVHDALGRAVESRDGLDNVTAMRYDARNNLRFLIDPEQAVTQRTYDGLDRMTRDAKPEGITVDYGYDASSRLTSYTDALHQATSYAYDALNRRKSVQYPDNTHESYTYDEAGNLWKVTDAKGTLVTQSYDLAHRLIGRSVAPASGVEGPFSESYAFDGLGRMTQAQSGNVITNQTYDSLSRLVREETEGKALGYTYDDAGNRVRIDYPSGYSVRLQVDNLNRATAIGQVNGTAPSAPFTPAVTYAYRGAGLLAGKNLANGLTGTYQYDAARRLIDQTFQTATGKTAFRESLAWTPRSLKAAQSRGDENNRGLLLAYDTAGRLLQAAKSPDPLAVAANNTKNEPAALAGLPDLFAYTYDAAQNLLAKTEKKAGATETVQLPLDGSHRNRPGAIAGTSLTWDANGNLSQKGDKQFHYDYRNRLTRVTTASTEIARYEYDAFNRRLSKTVDGVSRRTVWDGWTAVEEYTGDRLVQRRTFGLGLDEMVQVETDLDGQGDLDATYTPLYDSTGNLIAMTGADGKPIERYEYTPYGARTIRVDSTAPVVEQVRVKDGKLWLEISEEIAAAPLAQAVADGHMKLENLTGAPQAIGITVAQPVVTGRQARRRLIITTTDPPAAGTQVRLTLPPQALQDAFLNQPAQSFELTFAWPAADTVLRDTVAPKIERIAVQAGVLEVELSEEPDLTAATAAIKVDGQPLTWTRGEDRYTLKSNTVTAAGDHTLTISTDLTDVGGQAVSNAATNTFTLVPQDTNTLYLASDPRLTLTSTIGNEFGFQGLPRDPELGLIYVRNRYYDPELGRFITVDPMGYVDGPSAYGFAKNDPANGSDPMGLKCLGMGILDCGEIAESFFGSGAAQRSDQFAAGYVVGVAKVVGAVGVLTYTETGSFLYQTTGSHVYRQQHEDSQKLHAALEKVRNGDDAIRFVMDGASAGLRQAQAAAEKGDYMGVGEGVGNTIAQAAMFADAAQALTPGAAPGMALSTSTGRVAQSGTSLVLTNGGRALGQGISLMASGENSGAEDEALLDKARSARDARATELGPLRPPKRPAAVTAGYNTETGEVAVGCSGGGLCAEDRVVEALGGDSSKVRITEAVRPRPDGPPFQQVDVCPRCELRYGREAFPKTARFKSDG